MAKKNKLKVIGTNNDTRSADRPNPRSVYLALPQAVRAYLEQTGLRATRPMESHRRQDDVWLVMGTEAGGATEGYGHYVTFCDPIGAPVEGFYSYERRAPASAKNQPAVFNSRHTDVSAEVLIRAEMFREGELYQLLITRHEPDKTRPASDPRGSSVQVLFDNRRGSITPELQSALRKNPPSIGRLLPEFRRPTGEVVEIPAEWRAVVGALTIAVHCLDCTHAHYVKRPSATGHTEPVLVSAARTL